MRRRNFLGGVIGVLAGTQIPFKAEAVTFGPPVTGLLGKAKQIIRLMEVPEQLIYQCRMFVTLDNGIKIWAPGIQKVTRELEPTLKIILRSKEISMTRTMIAVSSGFVDDLGSFVKEAKFSSPVHVTHGDSLIPTYTIEMGW